VMDPPVYKYDKNPAGTILEQSPGPDTELTGPVELAFIVSRGPEKARVKVPELSGLALAAAIKEIEKSGVAFRFEMRPAAGKETPGTVVAQLPVPGTLQDAVTPVTVVYAAPAQVEGVVSALFSQPLPEYPYPLKATLLAEKPDGSMTPLITVEHPGTIFTLPYALPEGSVLVLQVLNRVVARVEAGK